jgi:hypothetical protein
MISRFTGMNAIRAADRKVMSSVNGETVDFQMWAHSVFGLLRAHEP